MFSTLLQVIAPRLKEHLLSMYFVTYVCFYLLLGICVATMSLALLVRISFTFSLMSFAGFSFKEKIFIALSWMPKATVQVGTY